MTLENIKTQEDLRNYLGNTIIPVPYFLFKIVKSYFQELSFNEIGLSIDFYKVLSEKEDENQNINVPFQYVSKVLDNFKNIPLATIEKYKTKGDSLHFLFEVNNELILQFNEIYKAKPLPVNIYFENSILPTRL